MFSVNKKKGINFNEIILKDESGGTFVEIIPTCGAILKSFNVKQGNDFLNVIDSYLSEIDFKKNVATNGFKGCKLSPFVCRLKEGIFKFDNKSFKIDKYFLGKHAIHGLLYDVPFDIVAMNANEKNASVVLMHQYDGLSNGFPFAYKCFVTYKLSSDNDLQICTTICNTSESEMPIQDGWHPYFTFDKKINKLQLQLNVKNILQFDNELIPTGVLLPYENFKTLTAIDDSVFDDCFVINNTDNMQPACIIKDVEKNMQVEIWPSTSYPYLQIYTPDNRRSIAIENLSGAPDGFNNGMGLQMLAPSKTVEFATTFKITNLIV
jgi:aldose 1-epimerase